MLVIPLPFASFSQRWRCDFLTRRFIGEYASNAECISTKHLNLDARQIHLEIYDPCSQPWQGKLSLTDELHWADGFIIVYDISDRASFAFAKALLYRIQESHIGACKKMVESAVVLIGNKQDLCHMKEVDWDEGQKLAMDNKCHFSGLSAAEHYQEVVAMFTKLLRNITSNFKAKRRPSGSKSMAKLNNDVFGKRRKSV
ncbi:ras-related and estrogen-regulated growth inhibitor-like protein [Aythya fuligula]|uniref:small monomeric GTPase n=1 Tax=Aythya fuligula TaxID=219594 RepID=A0A6J3CVN6_AYTFU|nr:ras-related and estrogen-regulated growth inhibitor-like protein [Aythya fuligula]